MTETIITKDNKANRTIELPAPKVFLCEDLKSLVKILTEDMCMNMIKAQLMVSYRSMIRTKLSATDDNGDFVNTDEKLVAEDFSEWKPEPRTRKSPEEKAKEALSALSPEVIAQLLKDAAKEK